MRFALHLGLGAIRRTAPTNAIGTPGRAGFGVGICPASPAGYTPRPRHRSPSSPNYGNYTYSDGSVMVWIPAFRLRWGSELSPRWSVYGVNSCDVAPVSAHASEAAANAEGFYLHRAFINGGVVQPGFFYDKYKCSNNAGVASSLPLGSPLVSGPQTGQVGFSALNGAPTNAYHGAIPAARTRGAQFFPASVFMRDALAVLAMAHGQAVTSTTACAWYDASGVRNFPLGCNNNALKDANDSSLTFVSAGASAQPMMPLTGSASVLAKTTHNGQACGVSDVNGAVWDINPGVTSDGVDFYVLKSSVDLAAVGSGASAANDLWGAAGIAAMYDKVTYAFDAGGPGTRYGNGVARVFAWSTEAERTLTMAGFPAPGGSSASGINLFGQDYFYQGKPNQLCVLSGGNWGSGVTAGVRARVLSSSRTGSSNNVGFVAASYLT